MKTPEEAIRWALDYGPAVHPELLAADKKEPNGPAGAKLGLVADTVANVLTFVYEMSEQEFVRLGSEILARDDTKGQDRWKDQYQ